MTSKFLNSVFLWAMQLLSNKNCSACLQLCLFVLGSQTHTFPELIDVNTVPSTSFREAVSCICNIVTMFCYIPHFFHRQHGLLNYFFNMHASRLTIFSISKVLWVFTLCHVIPLMITGHMILTHIFCNCGHMNYYSIKYPVL